MLFDEHPLTGLTVEVRLITERDGHQTAVLFVLPFLDLLCWESWFSCAFLLAAFALGSGVGVRTVAH